MKINFKKNYHYITVFLFSILLLLFRINHSLNIEPVFGNYDSESYFNFSLFGGLRMPLITFIYYIIKDLNNIVLFQTFLSFFSFFILSLSIFKFQKNRVVSILISLSILFLGNTNQVVYLDSTIDSESLNISFLVIFITSLIYLFNSDKENIAKWIFIFSLILFCGIKTMNNVASIFVIFVIILLSKNVIINQSRKLISVVPFMILVLANIYYFLNVSVTPELNTSGIINSRIWEVPKWREKVLSDEFPVEARSIYLRFKNENLGLPPDTAVGNLPQFKKWYKDSGKYFLLEFMATHPGYTFLGPIGLPFFSNKFTLNETIWRGAATGVLDINTYFSPNSQFSKYETMFWPLERTHAYIYLSFMLLILGLGLQIIMKDKSRINDIKLLQILLLLSFFLGYFAWWFGSTPPDLGRHQFPFAVSLRIISLISLLFILDKISNSKTFRHFLGRN